ncbi:MAG UNVERIFIED_CONTAM: hypothetical protein LVT10_20925 [Anaerolineae bacterium]
MNEQHRLDYGMIGESGTLEAEPGLWLHVVRVATTQADLTINYLLRNTPQHIHLPANTVILANRFLEIMEGTLTPCYYCHVGADRARSILLGMWAERVHA